MPFIFFIAGVVLFLAACGTPPPCQGAFKYTTGECVPAASIDDIRSAAEAVHSFYGTQQPLPELVVYDKGDCSAVLPASLVTPGAHGNVTIPQGKITLPDGKCVYGAWYPQDNAIYMTRVDWKHTIAHELLHQRLKEMYGDSDGNHERAEWNTWMPMAVDLIDYL